MAVEQNHNKPQKADDPSLMLVSGQLHVSETHRVINRQVDTVVADAEKVALLALAREAMSELAEAGQLFDIDMDQISGMLSLVALNRGSMLRKDARTSGQDPAIARAKGIELPTTMEKREADRVARCQTWRRW